MSEVAEQPITHTQPAELTVPEEAVAPMSETPQSVPAQEIQPSPADLAALENAMQTINDAKTPDVQTLPATPPPTADLPAIEVPAGKPAEARPAAIQTLKTLATRLGAPFRGIMNLLRSIGRWIVK